MTKRFSPICRKQVKETLEGYREQVEGLDLATDTKRTYLRHAETFVRWLHGNFEPGARNSNRLSFFLIALLVAISVLAPAIPSIAGSEEDAARIERKFEIRELAREIVSRVEKRLNEAIAKSATIQREIKYCDESYEKRSTEIAEGKEDYYELWKKWNAERDDCWESFRLGNVDEDAIILLDCLDKNKQSEEKMMLDDWRTNMALEYSREWRDDCRENSITSNSAILNQLREEFIDEEIETLRDSLEEPKRKELKREIRELSA